MQPLGHIGIRLLGAEVEVAGGQANQENEEDASQEQFLAAAQAEPRAQRLETILRLGHDKTNTVKSEAMKRQAPTPLIALVLVLAGCGHYDPTLSGRENRIGLKALVNCEHAEVLKEAEATYHSDASPMERQDALILKAAALEDQGQFVQAAELYPRVVLEFRWYPTPEAVRQQAQDLVWAVRRERAKQGRPETCP